MIDIIIILVLAVLVILAGVRAVRHFSGGGCCGSKGGTIRDNKPLDRPKLGEKTLTIEGMTCVNCEIRVENALGRIPHAAARVSHKKKTAVVSYSAEIADEVLRNAVEKLGYQVTAIH